MIESSLFKEHAKYCTSRSQLDLKVLRIDEEIKKHYYELLKYEKHDFAYKQILNDIYTFTLLGVTPDVYPSYSLARTKINRGTTLSNLPKNIIQHIAQIVSLVKKKLF